jgi:hypothetical protein
VIKIQKINGDYGNVLLQVRDETKERKPKSGRKVYE